MSRIRQRRFAGYSESAAIVSEPAINSLTFDCANASAVADVEKAGFWEPDFAGVWHNNTPLNTLYPGQFNVDMNGCIVWNSALGDNVLGEYSHDPETDYTAQILAPRILRSDILIDYTLGGGMLGGGNARLRIYSFRPDIIGSGVVSAFDFTIDASAGTLVEATSATNVAYSSEYDCENNKLLISCTRISGTNKQFVATFYDRTLVANVVTTVNWNGGAGFGDLPIMWAIQLSAIDNVFLRIKSIKTSSAALAYGAIPV